MSQLSSIQEYLIIIKPLPNDVVSFLAQRQASFSNHARKSSPSKDCQRRIPADRWILEESRKILFYQLMEKTVLQSELSERISTAFQCNTIFQWWIKDLFNISFRRQGRDSWDSSVRALVEITGVCPLTGDKIGIAKFISFGAMNKFRRSFSDVEHVWALKLYFRRYIMSSRITDRRAKINACRLHSWMKNPLAEFFTSVSIKLDAITYLKNRLEKVRRACQHRSKDFPFISKIINRLCFPIFRSLFAALIDLNLYCRSMCRIRKTHRNLLSILSRFDIHSWKILL